MVTYSPSRGIKKVIIRQRPEFEPTPKYQTFHEGLVKKCVSYTRETNQFVSLKQDLEKKLHSMQLRKIKKCKKTLRNLQMKQLVRLQRKPISHQG